MSKYYNMGVCKYLLFVVFTFTLNMATLNGIQNFPMSIYHELYTKPTKCVFLSPLGIKSSLAAAAYIAEGNTKDEIFEVINHHSKLGVNFTGQPIKKKKFQMDSLKHDRHIYLNKALDLSPMKELFSNEYKYTDVPFDTQVSKYINDFVKNETKRWVDRILPNSLNKQTAAAKINSLYFHSSWKTEFTSTMKRGFKKPMMHQYGDFLYANLTDLNAAVLQMEFQGNEAKMLIFQPNDNNLQRLTDQLMNVNLTKIHERLNRTYMSLFFPIINEIKMSVSLKDALKRMGVEQAFQKDADFSPMIKGNNNNVKAFIREMRHHTSFKCGRENARFVAVTGTQWDLDNTTKQCTCVEDENTLEYANPDNTPEDIILVPMKKSAPHYYFEHKLFFALTHQDEVVFLGTVAREK